MIFLLLSCGACHAGSILPHIHSEWQATPLKLVRPAVKIGLLQEHHSGAKGNRSTVAALLHYMLKRVASIRWCGLWPKPSPAELCSACCDAVLTAYWAATDSHQQAHSCCLHTRYIYDKTAIQLGAGA